MVLAAVVQVGRIVVKPAVRRELVARPILSGVAIGTTLVVAAFWIGAVRRWPSLLLASGAVAGIGLIGFWWRARPDYGRQRGWPRGSLGNGESFDAIESRTFYRDRAQRYGPIFKTSQFGRPVACLVGLGAARELLHGHPAHLAGATLPYNRLIPKGTLRYMTPEDHRREAVAFRSAMTGVDLSAGERVVRDSCCRMLAAWATASKPHGVGPLGHLRNWVDHALGVVFFGVEPADPMSAKLVAAQHALAIDRMGEWGWSRRTEAAFEAATALLRAVAGDRAGRPDQPTDSILSGLLAAAPAALDDPTRARNLFLAYRISTADVAGLLDWVLAQLTDAPEWIRAVRAQSGTAGGPTGSQPTDLASRVVLETLRLEQSEYLYRRVTRPIELAGATIPAGWLVRICVQESHRDPAIYPNPDRFDPDRFLGRVFGRSEYSPFGADNHGCLGAMVALFLGRIFVEELCHGYDWQLAQDGPPERGTRHRHHWRPSSQRRFVLSRLADAGWESTVAGPRVS